MDETGARTLTFLNVIKLQLLTKILSNRLLTKFAGYQPKEQADFRKGFI